MKDLCLCRRITMQMFGNLTAKDMFFAEDDVYLMALKRRPVALCGLLLGYMQNVDSEKTDWLRIGVDGQSW